MTAIRHYLTLTKPTIMLLVLFTGATALVMEGSLLSRPIDFLLVMLALYLTGGCANALNQYFERDIDARMSRTSGRRPLPQSRLTPRQALTFSLSIGALGVFIFAFWFNWLAALMSLATILFYSLVYTLILKPRTSQNIVIGGAAGAMAPVGAWAAASGSTAIAPWLLFLIVFLWTPPHFWALAMAYKEDYVRAKLPMMPVVKGDRSTLYQMITYSLALVAVTLLFPFFGTGWFYLVAVVVLGFLFLMRLREVSRSTNNRSLKKLFGYSILYLFGVFLAAALDALI
jgi:protoheme IX farnesyltransferase